MAILCEFCKKDLSSLGVERRFCGALCQRKHYNRRPEIREKCRLRVREYRRTHPEWREKHRILQSKYKEKRKLYRSGYFKRPEVKAKMRDRARVLRKNNPNFAIAERLRKSLRHALTKYSDNGKMMSSKRYGINWKEVIEHLKPFPINIEDYEIDHIIPLHTFNLTDIKEVKRAFSPENLQWLTKYENRSKGGRIISIN
jgi:hypothetical protein